MWRKVVTTHAISILIGPAGPERAAAVLDVMQRAFAEYRGVLQPESSVFAETEAEIAAKLAQGGGLVAETDRTVVGCVIAEVKGEKGYLGRLAIDPGWRRFSLARQLMDAGEDFLRRRGLTAVEVNVRIALAGNIALFERLGYRETQRLAHPGWSQPTYLVMEKSLE